MAMNCRPSLLINRHTSQFVATALIDKLDH